MTKRAQPPVRRSIRVIALPASILIAAIGFVLAFTAPASGEPTNSSVVTTTTKTLTDSTETVTSTPPGTTTYETTTHATTTHKTTTHATTTHQTTTHQTTAHTTKPETTSATTSTPAVSAASTTSSGAGQVQQTVSPQATSTRIPAPIPGAADAGAHDPAPWQLPVGGVLLALGLLGTATTLVRRTPRAH